MAIADVGSYVREGSALDREARLKANSVYFPDRVEPMLPERLSNALCSLREGENRACIAVRMVFDAAGGKRSHRFVRGLMRSAAKLSYEQAQAAIDGQPDDVTGPLLEPVLTPLWAAYGALKIARERSFGHVSAVGTADQVGVASNCGSDEVDVVGVELSREQPQLLGQTVEQVLAHARPCRTRGQQRSCVPTRRGPVC